MWFTESVFHLLCPGLCNISLCAKKFGCVKLCIIHGLVTLSFMKRKRGVGVGGGGLQAALTMGFSSKRNCSSFIMCHSEKRHHLKVWCGVLVDQCCLDVYLQFTVFMKCWQVPTVTDCALKLPCTGAFVKQGDWGLSATTTTSFSLTFNHLVSRLQAF